MIKHYEIQASVTEIVSSLLSNEEGKMTGRVFKSK